MKHLEQYDIIENNKIVIRKKSRSNEKIYSQMKRVPKNFPLTKEERKAVVAGKPVTCVKMIMNRLSCGLCEAHKIYKSAKN